MKNISMAKRYCPLFNKCGGCDSVNSSYEDELLEKYIREEKFLSRFAPVSPILPSPSVTGYRCKVQAVCGEKDGKLITGIYRKGSHRLISVKSCPLEDERAGEILSTIRVLSNRYGIKAYDEDRMTGDLRHVLIRTSDYYDEALVVLVASSLELKSGLFISAILTSSQSQSSRIGKRHRWLSRKAQRRGLSTVKAISQSVFPDSISVSLHAHSSRLIQDRLKDYIP